MISLVGSTGFVGGNILHAAGEAIQNRYHAIDIEQAYGTQPDLLIYAGLRAEKFLANQDAAADLNMVHQAEENITRIAPKHLVLISTIDVLKNPVGIDEDAPIDTRGLQPYGWNRYLLEQWARIYDPRALIVRLPALYGINLRKNFLYDYLHVIPKMLREDKFRELNGKEGCLQEFYQRQDNGFYKCRPLTDTERTALKAAFTSLGFTALHFTDSRSVYQFYPLSHLWTDLQIALEHELPIWHPATEPVSVAEVYYTLTGKAFHNEIAQTPAFYDYRTKYAHLFGRSGPYIISKQDILEDIRRFIGGWNL